MRKVAIAIALILAMLPIALDTGSSAASIETGFDDVSEDNILAEPIAWLRLSGITRGCNPPLNTHFCPTRAVTRGEMAAFLVRALPPGQPSEEDWFTDDDESVFESDINRLAAVGTIRGCNPPHNDRFCPNETLTRGEMAALLSRAFELPTPDASSRFLDTAGSVFEADIDKLAAAAITIGCNPPDNDRFCPTDWVTRQQAATFLWRAFKRSPSTEPNRLVAAGDIARCELESDEATARLVDTLFSDADGVVAVLGDAVYDRGTPTEFSECYEPSWGRHRSRTYPAVGNHEYRTAGAAGYFDYFGAAAGDPETGWYEYSLSGWQIIVLNSNCSQIGGCHTGSAQQSWLQERLESSNSSCSIAYMHHPRFSSGHHGDDAGLESLWATLEAYGVDIVLAGHDHNYERLDPLTATGELAGPDGIQSFVVGTGGTYLRDANEPRSGSQVLIDDHHGVLSMDLHDESYEWQFIDTSGAVLDQGTRSCN